MLDVDNDYEWESTLSEWEGYENSTFILQQRIKWGFGDIYESTKLSSPDEDYEFDEDEVPRANRSDVLINVSPTEIKSTDKKQSMVSSALMMTALQDRVAKSLSRLNIPEWAQKKGVSGSQIPKAHSHFPRFPRYNNDDFGRSEATLASPSPLRIR